MTSLHIATIATDVERPEGRYARLARMIATDTCVILDGATGTELIEVGGQRPEVEEHLWGVTAILDSPADVEAVHRRYVEAGCDVISTNTWGLPTALRDGPQLWESSRPVHWMDVARRGVRLARGAAAVARLWLRGRRGARGRRRRRGRAVLGLQLVQGVGGFFG